jgi:hypothetical protein
MRLYGLLLPTKAKADHQRAAVVDEAAAGAATEAAARKLITHEIKHEHCDKRAFGRGASSLFSLTSDLRWSVF